MGRRLGQWKSEEKWGFYRVMVLGRTGNVRRSALRGSLCYLFRLLGRTRHHKLSIVGRCWIEKNTEPALLPKVLGNALGTI